MNWNQWANEIVEENKSLSKAEALAILQSTNEELLEVLHAAFHIRNHFYGRTVSLHLLQNAKSGACPEDCSFCSQSKTAQTDVPEYALQTVEEIVNGAAAAIEADALRYCVVTSTRAPSENDLQTLCAAAQQIKIKFPQLELCASMGFLDEKKAKRLCNSGIDRFNHNLETSARFYPSICSTHRFEDRVQTARIVKKAGMDLCSGGLIGMGERLEDRVDLAFELKAVGADSAPINFLDPREGTSLEALSPLTPQDALRTLCMFRFVLREAEVRVAGGREKCLRSLQSLALYPANSIFTNGYLTTDGQGVNIDRQMIYDADFQIGHLVRS